MILKETQKTTTTKTKLKTHNPLFINRHPLNKLGFAALRQENDIELRILQSIPKLENEQKKKTR